MWIKSSINKIVYIHCGIIYNNLIIIQMNLYEELCFIARITCFPLFVVTARCLATECFFFYTVRPVTVSVSVNSQLLNLSVRMKSFLSHYNISNTKLLSMQSVVL